MKDFMVYVFLVILYSSCGGGTTLIDKDDTAWKEKCEGVSALAWQKEIQGADAETTAKVIANATIAAKADAKQANAEGELDAGFKSELARVINENVTKSSEVSEEFWVQESTFTRLYCLSVSLLDRNDISDAQKVKIVDDIREMQKAEAEYILGKQKKNL